MNEIAKIGEEMSTYTFSLIKDLVPVGDISFKLVDSKGVSHDTKFDMVWGNLFGFCCCTGGSDDLVFSMMKHLYDSKIDENGSFYYDNISKDKGELYMEAQELTLMLLDKLDITEHGAAVRGCWLTDKGLEVCSYLFGDGKQPKWL